MLSLHYNGGNSYFLLTEKIISLKQIIKMPTFQVSVAYEAYLINLTMSMLKKLCDYKQIHMIFQSIMMLLINLTCLGVI